MRLDRRTFCAGSTAALFSTSTAARERLRVIPMVNDFDEVWETLRDRYCFFAEKQTDWTRVRRLYRPQVIAAQERDSLDDFKDILRRTLWELYDPHTQLHDPPDGAPRWPFYDIRVRDEGGRVRIEAIQEGTAAAASNLRLGEDIISVNGSPIIDRARRLAPQCLRRPDPEAWRYALNAAVAGHRAQPRTLVVRDAAAVERTVALPLMQRPTLPNVEARRIDRFGYIRIRSFADEAVVATFDEALLAFRETLGLIIDVSDNGGGDTAVARPIMGRFIGQTMPYARMRRREGRGLSAPWTEVVEPRGPFTYGGRVVVLTNYWSASMAEGFPMGMRGLGVARIVGTPMMQLGAAVFVLRFDRTGLEAQYSAEPVYDVHDAPRWRLMPDVHTSPGADVIAAGVAELQRQLA